MQPGGGGKLASAPNSTYVQFLGRLTVANGVFAKARAPMLTTPYGMSKVPLKSVFAKANS